MTLTELSIKRPTMVVVIFSVLSVLGIFGFSQLKYDLMPKMTIPIITVATTYPGASPNEVENSVTKLIEDAVTGIEKTSNITGSSYEGISFVKIELDANANIDLALQDAQRKVNQVESKLPDNAKKPVISKIAFDEIPVLRLSVSGKMDTKELYQFIDDKIEPRIAKIAGVGQISLIGGDQREIKVNVDAERLKSNGLSLAAVTQAVSTANLDYPTGNIRQPSTQFVVRIAGKFKNIDEIKDLVVGRSKSGTEVRLQDIAEVNDGTVEPTNINRLNGHTSVGMQIIKQSDGNTVDVSKHVKKELAAMEKEYKENGIKFEIASDASEFILASAHSVEEDLIFAVILVSLVMLVFLHSLRNSLIVMVSIPCSLIATFFAMYISGFTLNMMTLLAMSLVVGILVDDSIVVLENIHRHLELGENKLVASLRGRNEIGFAALSITLVDVVVFLPLSLIQGVIGDFLRQYALVVVFSTLMSLFVSFTVTPTLASRLSKLEDPNDKKLIARLGAWFEAQFERLTNYYTKALTWSLRHGKKVVFASAVMVVISFSLFPMGLIGFEFMPQVDRGELNISIELEPGATLEETNFMTQRIEKMLNQIPEITKIQSNVGTSDNGMLGSLGVNNQSQIYVSLVDKNKRKKSTDDVSQDLKILLSKVPGIKLKILPVNILGTSGSAPIQVLVSGTNYADVVKSAKDVAGIIKGVEGTVDIRLSSEDGKPEIRVDIDRKKLSQLGLSIAEVGQNLRIALTGSDDSKYRDGADEFDIRVMLDRFDRTDPETVKKFTFINTKGQQVELQQFANVYLTTGPTKLERQNRMSSITIQSQVFGKTSGIVAQDITKKLNAYKFPGDVKYEYVGEQKNLGDSMLNLLLALGAGILFVYLIMVALYDSYIYPFVVLFSIPLAVIGAFLALALSMKSLSIYSMLGLIMLIGLVAKNAILLVDRTNQMRAEGLSTYEALLEAGKTRLRPILMTTLAMVIGMMPIAFATSAGSEAKSGLAMVLIGGLSSSLILTLVVVPIVYQGIEGWVQKFRKEKKEVVIE